MLTENLAILFERDILKVKKEISLFTDESLLWKITGDIQNSAGNLCLHLLGNLQHYIGHHLGKTDYVRNRPLEFSSKNIPAKDMMEELDKTATIVKQTILSLTEEQLNKEYPEKVLDQTMTTEYFILHLLAHLNYHLGQINYLRRVGVS